MMKVFLLIILSFSGLFHTVLAQTPTWAWAQAGTPNQGSMQQTGLGADATGNTYVTGLGYTLNGMTFGYTALPAVGMFLVKYDKAGKLVWAKHQEALIPKAMFTDAMGNCYITGMYRDTLRIGNSNIPSQGFSDIFVVKFDSTGNLVWLRTGGGPGRHPQTPPPILSEDEGTTIAADAAGNVYVGGYYFARTNTAATFDTLSLTPLPNTPANQEFGFLAKYNAAGHIQWLNKISFPGSFPSIKLAVSTSGDCYVTGKFGDSLILHATAPPLRSIGSDDVYFARFNKNGNLIWANSFGGTDSEYGQAIAVNNQNKCFLTGSFRSANLSIGSFNLSGSAQQGTVFIAKADSSGNILWASQTSGTGSIGDSDLAVDSIGNAYLSSSFTGTVTFGQQSLTASSPHGSLVVSKWGNSGIPLWTITAQGTGGTFKIASTGAEDVCSVSGNFTGNLDFGNHSLFSQNQGVFVNRFSSQPLGLAKTRNKDFSVFPNPARRELHIVLSGKQHSFIVQLTNVTGKTVLTRNLPAAETTLSLPELPRGIYLLTIGNEKQVYHRKVVIQ